MVAWKTLEAKDRLLAALIAAHPDKKLLDYRRIATYYGQGTTYDSIEGQFRIIRAEAKKLAEAVESGEQAAAPPRGSAATPRPPKNTGKSTPFKTPNHRNITQTPRANSTASAARTKKPAPILTDGVISGRVTKAKTPETARKSIQTLSKTNENALMAAVSEFPMGTQESVITVEDDESGAYFGDIGGYEDDVDWSGIPLKM